MADKYDSNGDYSGGYTGDFKRKSNSVTSQSKRDMEDQPENAVEEEHDETHISGASHKVNEYMSELLAEKQIIDPHKFHNAARLIDQEITKVQSMNRLPAREHKYVDIYRERPIKVSAKVLVPVREHPKFNFVGKLLGPKGNSMKRLQEETMCKMAVLGRGSMKDRAKEEELRASCDPKYAHLSDDLHVEISALGPPAEAHARVAFALAEVRKYLVPDNNDNIRQEQMREMDIIGGGVVGEVAVVGGGGGGGYEGGRGGRGGMRRGGGGGGMRDYGEYVAMGRSLPSAPPHSIPMRTATRTPVHHPHSHHSHSPAPILVPSSSSSSMPSSGRGVMPAKTKILSILDRARIAMEESYGGGGGGGGVYGEGGEALVVGGGGGGPGYEYEADYRSAGGRGGYEAEYETEDYYHRRSGDGGAGYESSQRWKSYKTSGGSSSRHPDPETSRYRSSPYARPPK